jgi:aryl-alcohol dehydrogenase-like predicted oxidoreductase
VVQHVESGVTVRALASALGLTAPHVISALLGAGLVKTINDPLTAADVQIVADRFRRNVQIDGSVDAAE